MGSQNGSVGSLTDWLVFQRGMLAQLAARLQARQGGAGDLGGGVVLGENRGAVLVDDNCSVSLIFAADDD